MEMVILLMSRSYPRKPFLSNKNGGMGIGLFLTQASISRYGGTVTINSFDDAGWLTYNSQVATI